MRYVDLHGRSFGRLVVIERFGHDKHNRALWKCLCKCGNEHIAAGTNLTAGYTKSCGCLFQELNTGITRENGKVSRLYSIWSAMKERCLNPKDKKYHRYGGRGISVCSAWMNFNNFHIWAISNGYRMGLMIERKNNDGNYEPDNCKWATPIEQSNNRSSNKIITFNGQTKTAGQWADHFRMNRFTLYSRLNKGWTIEKALTEPVRNLNR